MTTHQAYGTYANKGEGVHFPFGEPSKLEAKRIEELGLLNDRRVKYLGQRWKLGLFKLAAAYRRRGMPKLAMEIYAEAMGL